MQEYSAVLPETGSVSFEDYMSSLRAVGLRGENWLKAKHAGVIVVELDSAGNLTVSRPQPVAGGV